MDGDERERKRLRVSEDINEFAARNGLEVVDPSFFDDILDVEAAISSILGRVPDQSIYPKIILKHQLYCIIKNRTEVLYITKYGYWSLKVIVYRWSLKLRH